MNIEYACFQNCIGLIDINLCFTTGKLESSSFYGVSHLKSIEISSDSVEIKSNSFAYASKLSNLVLDSEATIHNGAFINNIELRSIHFSNNSKIYGNAFNGCTSLRTLYLEYNVNIYLSAFTKCSIDTVLFFEGLILYKNAFDIADVSFQFCGKENNTNEYTCAALKQYTNTVYVSSSYTLPNFCYLPTFTLADSVCKCYNGCNSTEIPHQSDKVVYSSSFLFDAFVFYATI